jgi:hypothetical protein
MKWLRCRDRGAETWALLDGEQAETVDGTPFGEHVSTGRRLPIADLDWLPATQPSKILALFGVVGPVNETAFDPASASVRTTVDGRTTRL